MGLADRRAPVAVQPALAPLATLQAKKKGPRGPFNISASILAYAEISTSWPRPDSAGGGGGVSWAGAGDAWASAAGGDDSGAGGGGGAEAGE